MTPAILVATIGQSLSRVSVWTEFGRFESETPFGFLQSPRVTHIEFVRIGDNGRLDAYGVFGRHYNAVAASTFRVANAPWRTIFAVRPL